MSIPQVRDDGSGRVYKWPKSIDEPRRRDDDALEQVTPSSEEVKRERDYFGNIVLTANEAAEVKQVSGASLILNLYPAQDKTIPVFSLVESDNQRGQELPEPISFTRLICIPHINSEAE